MMRQNLEWRDITYEGVCKFFITADTSNIESADT